MHPDKIIIYPLWGSSVFMRNSVECKRNMFGTIGNIINCPLDFIKFKDNSTVFLSEIELGAKFGVEVDADYYISLKQVV